jgi:DNA-binding CsgD family transcriptional regulator
VEVYLAAERWEDAESASAELGTRAEIHPLDALVAESTEARGRLHLARGEPESALGPLRKSFYYWQRIGIPYREARVRTLLARACSVLGDAEGAEQLLEQARAIFENLGAGPDAKSLGELSAPSPRSRSGARELSERERDVLRRVVHGDTNRKIAADLGLSEKTVDRHVSNIFVKMGVSSRTAAAAQALKTRSFEARWGRSPTRKDCRPGGSPRCRRPLLLKDWWWGRPQPEC